MVIASLAMAGLAGIGLDQLLTAHRGRLARWLRERGDRKSGGRDAGGATKAVVDSVAGSSATRRAVWAARLPRRVARRADGLCAHGNRVRRGLVAAAVARSSTQTWLGPSLLLLTACEIAWANGWMVLTAPASSLDVKTVISARAGSPFAVHDLSLAIAHVGSARMACDIVRTRAEESVRWDVATLYAKLHLLGPHRSLLPQSSIATSDLRTFVSTGSQSVATSGSTRRAGCRVSPGAGGLSAAGTCVAGDRQRHAVCRVCVCGRTRRRFRVPGSCTTWRRGRPGRPRIRGRFASTTDALLFPGRPAAGLPPHCGRGVRTSPRIRPSACPVQPTWRRRVRQDEVPRRANRVRTGT